jgi:hypothetical protein
VALCENWYLVLGKLGVRPLSRVDDVIHLNVNGGCGGFSQIISRGFPS